VTTRLIEANYVKLRLLVDMADVCGQVLVCKSLTTASVRCLGHAGRMTVLTGLEEA
jgi:hypothetical protein